MIPRGRLGFTLLEAIVALAILAVLIALAVPAVLRARAIGDEAICATRLRQLGQAAHHFDRDYGRLPPGYLGPSREAEAIVPAAYYQGQWIGHLPMLLPYLEQRGLWEKLTLEVNFDPTVIDRKWWIAKTGEEPNPATYRLAMTPVKHFLCPAAPVFEPLVGSKLGGTVIGIHVFHNDKGIRTIYWGEDYKDEIEYRFLAPTHYVGCAGTGVGTNAEYLRWAGVFTNRSSLSLAGLAARDGPSNTLLYGEAVGSRDPEQPARTRDLSWTGSGALGTYDGLVRGQESTVMTFSSHHIRGVPFCFGDGSVRWLRYQAYGGPKEPRSPAWLALQQLAGVSDGGLTDLGRILLD
jgi:prepilin-type N-terminal cleavage/methylation domain-containing protein